MKEHPIALGSLAVKGHVKYAIDNGKLLLTVQRAIHAAGSNTYRDRILHAMMLPGRYRLPFRISAVVKLEGPELIFLIGAGHVTFGAPTADNRRMEDIAAPNGKPRMFDSRLPYGQTVAVDIVYGLKEMQVLIDGEERFYSRRERYMRANNLAELGSEGLAVGITATKGMELTVKSLILTEYDEHAPITGDTHIDAAFIPAAPQPVPGKPRFDSCIEQLPEEFQAAVRETEQHLKSLKRLKFKRVIDKNNQKITWISSAYGVSYAVYLSEDVLYHSLQWYLVTNGKAETWHRIANMMEPALERISQENPGLADRIFFALNECIVCRPFCLARTAYAYHGMKKQTCHGQAFFKMSQADFRDIRDFFTYLAEMEPVIDRTPILNGS